VLESVDSKTVAASGYDESLIERRTMFGGASGTGTSTRQMIVRTVTRTMNVRGLNETRRMMRENRRKRARCWETDGLGHRRSSVVWPQNG
jgi:hypothetical protein